MKFLKYFEKRKKTYPQDVKGRFRRIKNFTNFFCLAIFFLFPFIRWDRGSFISNQAILVDLPNSRAYFFFIEMWPEEVFYLAAILIFAAVALFFVTSLFGRAWCGYSCPQTVWTDIFIKIERYFQGDRNDRIKLDRKVFSFQNIWRKAATHISWLLIGLVTGIGFVNYFNDAPNLMKGLFVGQIGWTIWGWILGVAGMTYVMAGFAREQVCNYMCPYARFQSAMFDPETLVIAYDASRGEDRGKFKKGQDFDNRGHCIDCKQCVVVCPANIDIRDGLQMECIACGLCIDACDNVMEKMDLPKGLIKYSTEIDDNKALDNKEIANKSQPLKAGNSCGSSSQKVKIFRPKTFYYLAILIIVGGFIAFNLGTKSDVKLDIIADRNPMFVMLSNGDFRNGYTIKISNKTFADQFYNLKIKGIKYSEIKLAGTEKCEIGDFLVKAGEVASFKIYVRVPSQNLPEEDGQNEIEFIISDYSEKSIAVKSIFISR
ncbi:MAG: cytochrome c oxidase accessory protein FixG [Rickettsiales bacterium]|jgi:cytochrome c oxidase accessory protein FixG